MEFYKNVGAILMTIQMVFLFLFFLFRKMPLTRNFEISKILILMTRLICISFIFCFFITGCVVYSQNKIEKEKKEKSKQYLVYTKDMLIEVVERSATKHGVPPELAKSLVIQESNWNPKAISSSQAVGLCQVMPSTFIAYAGKNTDIFNPEHNADVAMKYLAELKLQNKTWKKALAIYNGGYAHWRSVQAQKYAEEVCSRVIDNL